MGWRGCTPPVPSSGLSSRCAALTFIRTRWRPVSPGSMIRQTAPRTSPGTASVGTCCPRSAARRLRSTRSCSPSLVALTRCAERSTVSCPARFGRRCARDRSSLLPRGNSPAMIEVLLLSYGRRSPDAWDWRWTGAEQRGSPRLQPAGAAVAASRWRGGGASRLVVTPTCSPERWPLHRCWRQSCPYVDRWSGADFDFAPARRQLRHRSGLLRFQDRQRGRCARGAPVTGWSRPGANRGGVSHATYRICACEGRIERTGP